LANLVASISDIQTTILGTLPILVLPILVLLVDGDVSQDTDGNFD
jgi:hypothetical protein